MSRIVHIHHFVDPHCFYFKFADDLHDEQLQILEEEISKTAHEIVKKNKLYASQNGDIVAAYVVAWNKWVRAQVLENLTHFERYKLWALDHGTIFQTDYTNVVSLPTDLKEKIIKGVNRGCIYGITPAKMDLNLNTLEPELVPCKIWSQKAIKQCIEIINNENIRKMHFEITENHNDYFFGQLIWEAYDKKSRKVCRSNLGDALQNIHEAIPAEFNEDVSRIMRIYEKAFDTVNENGSSAESVISSGNSVCDVQPVASSYQYRVDAPKRAASTVVPSEIDGGFTRMQIADKPWKPAPSIVPSTVVPSEIDGGFTRMQIGNKMQRPTPSIVSSSVVPSEINGGKTRMKNHPNRQYNSNYRNHQPNRNGAAYMPAGHEREIREFNKFNQ